MSKFIDMTGWIMKEHGVQDSRITVIERDLARKGNGVYWICKCDCGNIFSAHGAKLRNGWTRSCGCLQKEITSNRTRADLTGQVFGYLTAIECLGKKNHNVAWLCKCKCGNTKIVSSNNLMSGEVQSCGCLKSKGEELVAQILRDNHINFIREYNLGNLKNIPKSNARIDFGIIDINSNLIGAIEVNGVQHYDKTNPWHNQGVEDNLILKKEYLINNNIPFLILPYINKKLDNDKLIQFIKQFQEDK